MKKNWLKKIALLIAVLITAVTAGCSINGNKATSGTNAGSSSSQLVQVKFGLDTAAGGSPEARMAKEKGIFQKYGIDAELSDFPYGIDTINALLINRTDTGLAADYALLNSLGKGDMVVVSTLTRGTDTSAKNNVLFVKGNINSGQDLVGKRLGVPRGTVWEYIWAKYLEKQNINPSQVKYIYYSSPDEAIVAMQKNEMDAVWASGALIDKIKILDGVKQLADCTAAGVYTKSFLVMQRSFVDNNPEVVGNILKALDESTKYVASHQDEAAELLYNKIKLPKDGVLSDLKASDHVIGFSQDDFDVLNQMKTWLTEKGILKENYDLKDKIDLEPLKKVLPDSVTYQA